ncbi:hypothetical protein BRARA_F03629 [Brassica rapa]|uniref:DNA replication licensing factor MCM3 n=1 Tax=Brassica campestris TaxID=3711 RepID=A0A397Z4I5_BRACM|nr:hypothetical protein BRARA_F03629 [Brassica rapa]
MDEIKALVQNKRHRLIINVSDIHTHFRESESSSRILKNPIEYMQSFCDAATEATRNIDPKYLKEGEQVLVGFEGHFVSRRVTPRELLSEFIGSLDRVAIHEVMEQQTVTIAKAGIHASLNARCSVVAAANPIYGTYDRSLTPTKNIGLPDSLLSRFDLLFIVLDQMDAGIDSMISEHVLRMHRYQNDRGEAGPDGNLPYGREEDGESEVFVKYNRMLHGKKKKRGQTNEKTLTIKFLKKYIHYAKHRIQPELTDEASERIAEAYADLRNAGSDTKTGGTLPITARTLETIIRLATAHAKLKLSRKVTKTDAEAALKLMNFAIYHQELTEMDEREQEERQREQSEQERTPSGHRGNQENVSVNVESETADPMDVDEPPSEQFSGTVSAARIESFERVFGQHMRTNRLDDISVADIETVVNNNGVGASRYSADEIMALLEKLQDDNKVMISDGKVHII